MESCRASINSHVISGTEGPSLLITAGVHGDEFEPMTAVVSLIDRLKDFQLRGTVTLAPVVNAAAFARGDRVAEDQLDLARVCPGRADGSITERTAEHLSQLIRAADYYIDLHTGGKNLSLLPLAGYMLHKNPQVLEAQRNMAFAFNLPFIWGTSASLNGRSLSVARDAGVPAIYVEYGGGGTLNGAGQTDLVEGCLNVLSALKMLHRGMPRSCVANRVEDTREQSGHLQMNYPSPLDGIFRPAVLLGSVVERAAMIGDIVDPLTGSVAKVNANEGGMVIMLRTWPRVRQGDALAAIVPIASPPAGDIHGH